MEGFFLMFYVEEKQTHHGVLLWEWLLKEAVKLGVRGGSAVSGVTNAYTKAVSLSLLAISVSNWNLPSARERQRRSWPWFAIKEFASPTPRCRHDSV